MSDELILEFEDEYIGSAVSPTVDITETTTDVTVTITDFQGDHSYTIEKTDQAIADAETAASNANTAAANATSTANQAAQYARTTADQAAADAQETADAAAGRADTAAASANQAAQAATQAAGTANTAAQNADAKAALADSKAALANQAATTANQAAEAAEAAKTAANTAAGQATTAATNATTAAGTANTAATNADAKAQLADTAAANADTATANANTATTNATNAAQAANNAADVAIEAAETITDGYFPKMLAGAAESLMGETDTATFAERVSTHDGVARIEAIQGNTVAWNQLCEGVNTTQPVDGLTRTLTDTGGLNLTGTIETNPGYNQVYIAKPVTLKRDGTKYLVKASKDTGLPLTINGYNSSGQTQAFMWQNTAGGTWNGAVCLLAQVGTTINLTDIHVSVFDLTRMFGAGNEPATVEEFEAMFPADYYPYSAGELLSVSIEGVNDREIPVSTYFPDGMRSAGTAYDELQRDKAVKRIGAVDLGTLNWVYDDGVFDVTFYLKANGSNLICPLYTNIGNTYRLDILSKGDMKIGGNSGNKYIYITDSRYTTAETFKTAMSGVYLYYELATPTTVAIDPPLTMTYTVENGGTESIVILTGENSAAPTMAIVYGLTADGVVDKALSVIAPIEGATASTNYSVNAYLVHNQQLYRVTSAIATGEAITPGSNCVACTVMGELARLTA